MKGKNKMALLTWSERYSVGVEMLDEQHRKMIDALNHLHEAMLAKQPPSAIAPLVAQLEDCTSRHFATEEQLMAAASYPQAEQHRAEHGVLLQQIERCKKLYQSGDIALSGDVLEFLQGWLGDHILEEDKEYGPWLNQHPTGAVRDAANPSA